jgi:hypothetical protein
VIELRDELVDALGDVLALLVRLEHLLLERVDASRLLLDLAAQARVLDPQAPVALGERFDRALQSSEVVRTLLVVALAIGNGRPPLRRRS